MAQGLARRLESNSLFNDHSGVVRLIVLCMVKVQPVRFSGVCDYRVNGTSGTTIYGSSYNSGKGPR